MLLSSDCDEARLTELWSGTKLDKKETAAVLEVFALLQPYTPPKDAPKCSASMLPIVIISKFVQRATGYASFSREICLYASPASIYTLHLDAPAVYELFGSYFGDYFLLHLNAADRITLAQQARNNKLVQSALCFCNNIIT